MEAEKHETQIQIHITKYQVAIDKNIAESDVLWNRYSAMLIFNTLLIATLGAIDSEDSPKLYSNLTILIPVVGIFSCYLWYCVTSRGFSWIRYYKNTARKIEKKYLKDSVNNLNPLINEEEFGKNIRPSLNTEIAATLLIMLVALIYGAIFFSR